MEHKVLSNSELSGENKTNNISDEILDLNSVDTIESLKQQLEKQSIEISDLKKQLNNETYERKNKEIFLENQVQLKLVTDALPVLISYIDTQERYLFNNEMYHEWFNLNPQDILGKTVKEIGGEEYYNYIRPYLKRAFNGETVKLETLANLPVAGEKYLRVNYVPDIKDNKVVGCFIMGEDISKEKKIERELIIKNKQLEEANQRLKKMNIDTLIKSENLEEEIDKKSRDLDIEKRKLLSVLTEAPAVIAIWKGPEHIFEYANDNYLKTFGYRELINKPIREALPELEGQGIYELLDEVYKTGKPFVGKEVYTAIDKNNDGNLEVVYWNFVYQPVYDEDENIVGIFDFAYDVTEIVSARTKLEKLNKDLTKSESDYKALSESLEIKVEERTIELYKATQEIEYQRNKLDYLLKTAQAAICLLEGPDHVFTFTNSLYEEQFGKNMVGKPIREALPIYEGQGYFELLDNVFNTGESFSGKESPAITNINGVPTQCYYDFIYQPVYNTNNEIEGVSAFIYDVTEQVIAKKEMEKLNRILNRSNESLQNFAYIASHDLQEPLRMVSSYSQLLVKRYKDKLDENGKEFLDIIQDGTKRMKKLIDDILNYSKISKKDDIKTKVNVNNVIEEVKYNLQLSIQESNAIIEYSDLPDVTVEKAHLVQLFQNIIGNAVKYRKKDSQLKISINSKMDDNKWLFSVTDNGIGINKENFDKIFEIFRRLHGRGEYEGTGIGLANCKKIVEIYDGRIWVDSQEGEGTTFYFTLPS